MTSTGRIGKRDGVHDARGRVSGAGGAPDAPDRCGGPTASATPARAAFRSRALARAAGTLLALAMLLIPPAAAQAQTTTCSVAAGETEIWSATLTVGTATSLGNPVYGYTVADSLGTLSPATFTFRTVLIGAPVRRRSAL